MSVVDSTFCTIPTVRKLWSEIFLFPPEPLLVSILLKFHQRKLRILWKSGTPYYTQLVKTTTTGLSPPIMASGNGSSAKDLYEDEKHLMKLCDFLRSSEGPPVREAVEMKGFVDSGAFQLMNLSTVRHWRWCASSFATVFFHVYILIFISSLFSAQYRRGKTCQFLGRA